MLNLAPYSNSLARSTKSTLSDFNVLQLLVGTRFQVLFHSPPGVLFTFPSRYFSSIGHQVVFSLGRWSSLLPTRFLVSGGTLDASLFFSLFIYRTFTFCGLPSQVVQLRVQSIILVRNPILVSQHGLGSSPFARRYLENRLFFLLLRVLRCFSSPGFPSINYFVHQWITFRLGFPIRISPDRWLFAPPRSFSQLIASFIGSWCQGILRAPLLT